MGEWFRAGPHPSGWDFEHYHRGDGQWSATASKPDDSYMSLDYTKHPNGKVEFDRGSHQFNHERDPENAALLKQHVLDFHNAKEHVSPHPDRRRALYHGTAVPNVTHILPAAVHGGAVHHSTDVTDVNYAYATHSKEDAWEYAMEAAGDEKRPRVYRVHPIGGYKHVEDDPDWDPVHQTSRGVRSEDKRSLKGFKVLKEMKAPQNVREWYDDETWGKD